MTVRDHLLAQSISRCAPLDGRLVRATLPHRRVVEPQSDESVQLDWGRGPFSVSEERRASHAAIVEDPGERSLYEAYARLAIAEGDPRGEYVRLGLLREQAAPPDQAAIDTAMQALRARYGRSIYAEWFPQPYAARLGRIVRDAAGYERWGFVARMTAGVADVPELRNLTPLASVELLGEGGPVARLPADADFRRLRGRKRLAVRDILRWVPEVRALVFTNLELGAAEAEMLGQLPHLESLTFVYRRPAELEAALARSDAFPRLNALSFWDCAVDLPRIGEIVRARALQRLEVECDGPRGLASLLSALSGSALESLTVCGIGPDLYAPLDCQPWREAWLPSLHTLWLGEYTLEHVEALAAAPVLQHLSTLELSGIENGAEVLRVLSTALPSSHIRRLSARDCLGLGSAYSDLAKACAFENLESLRLSDPRDEESGLDALLGTMPRLARLDVDGDISPELIPRALRLPALRELHPSFWNTDPDAAIAALLSGKSGVPLRSVNLPDLSRARDTAVHRLVDAPSLVELGSLALCSYDDALPPHVSTLLRRRFGHRLIPALRARRIQASDLEQGALHEPDLDPWWRP